MTRIKICGITNLQDARLAIKLGADALGFVFYPGSPRYINKIQAKSIIRHLPPFISKVGVFVDEDPIEVANLQILCQLDCLQFHGSEPIDYLKHFNSGKLIKAFRMKSAEVLEQMEEYKRYADAFLLDAYTEALPGGSGKTFNWALAEEAKRRFHVPIILSGGLTPENVAEALSQVRPYGVDVSTGVEASPGKKDYRKLKEFIENVRKFDLS